MIRLTIGLSWKTTKIRPTPLFFNTDLCSATSMESSHRDLRNDMAEHRSILENKQNTPYPRFSFTLKPDIDLPETEPFYCDTVNITIASESTENKREADT